MWIINSVTTCTLLINTNGKWIKRVSLEFISASIGLAWHGQLFRGTHFMFPSELEANDPLKLTIAKTFNNLIIFFSSKFKRYFFIT